MATKLTSQEPQAGKSGSARTPIKMGAAILPQTDKPEYIKAEDLETIFPFTIFSVSGPHKSRFNDSKRFNFGVAWKEGEQVIKKVLTLTENDDRRNIAFLVRKHGAITNCRLYEIQLGGGDYTYWKVWDADTPAPENTITGERHTPVDAEIPFA